jgi:hypothetical protein
MQSVDAAATAACKFAGQEAQVLLIQDSNTGQRKMEIKGATPDCAVCDTPLESGPRTRLVALDIVAVGAVAQRHTMYTVKTICVKSLRITLVRATGC